MNTDISPVSVDLYNIAVETRVPLKFGPETLTSVICARVCITVANGQGQTARGWGETPLSVQWAQFDQMGHSIELGSDFIESETAGWSWPKAKHSLCAIASLFTPVMPGRQI